MPNLKQIRIWVVKGMKQMLPLTEIAQRWGISTTRIARLCREGRIEGAQKDKKAWLIPADAQRPADGRVKSGNYAKRNCMEVKKAARLPLPIGISDYRRVTSEYYYVDKTLMIRDFLDEMPMVSYSEGNLLSWTGARPVRDVQRQLFGHIQS